MPGGVPYLAVKSVTNFCAAGSVESVMLAHGQVAIVPLPEDPAVPVNVRSLMPSPPTKVTSPRPAADICLRIRLAAGEYPPKNTALQPEDLILLTRAEKSLASGGTVSCFSTFAPAV